MSKAVFIFALALFSLGHAAEAHADDDGAYDRLEADVTLSIAAGGGVRFLSATEGVARVEARARYLDMAGVFVDGEWRVLQEGRFSFGVDLRPIFLARLLLGGSFTREWFDLLIDSIGLDLGLCATPLGQEGTGLALVIGTGLDIPLYRERTTRLAIRGAMRWVRGDHFDRFGVQRDVEDLSVFGLFVATFGVHTDEPLRDR